MQGRLGRAAIVTRAYWFVCPAIVANNLWCEQLVKEVQLTSICYVQICVYPSSYDKFLQWIDGPRSPTPPVPIAISSSQSPLLSVTPVRCMDTVNFINVKLWVCYSFSKHNIFSAKARESFIIVWLIEEIRLENQQHVSSTWLSKTLSLSLRIQRQCKMARGK